MQQVKQTFAIIDSQMYRIAYTISGPELTDWETRDLAVRASGAKTGKARKGDTILKLVRVSIAKTEGK